MKIKLTEEVMTGTSSLTENNVERHEALTNPYAAHPVSTLSWALQWWIKFSTSSLAVQRWLTRQPIDTHFDRVEQGSFLSDDDQVEETSDQEADDMDVRIILFE